MEEEEYRGESEVEPDSDHEETDDHVPDHGGWFGNNLQHFHTVSRVIIFFCHSYVMNFCHFHCLLLFNFINYTVVNYIIIQLYRLLSFTNSEFYNVISFTLYFCQLQHICERKKTKNYTRLSTSLLLSPPPPTQA